MIRSGLEGYGQVGQCRASSGRAWNGGPVHGRDWSAAGAEVFGRDLRGSFRRGEVWTGRALALCGAFRTSWGRTGCCRVRSGLLV